MTTVHVAEKKSSAERIATILENEALTTISDWLQRVEREDELTSLRLTSEQRTGHLPKLLQEIVSRLRVPRELGTKQVSDGAVSHGKIRQAQGYSISMIVEESRILQVSIFETLKKNENKVDFSFLLADAMTIVDECDSQLKQALASFMGQAVERERERERESRISMFAAVDVPSLQRRTTQRHEDAIYIGLAAA